MRPYVELYLNTTGQAERHGRLQPARPEATGSTDAVQAVAMHFRAWAGAGTFTNVPAAFVADASGGADARPRW